MVTAILHFVGWAMLWAMGWALWSVFVGVLFYMLSDNDDKTAEAGMITGAIPYLIATAIYLVNL